MSDELQGSSPIEQMSRTVNAIGVNMPKKRKNDLYFGKPPKDAYMGMNRGRDLSNIHDLTMSESQKNRLYGIGQKTGVKDVGEFTNVRLETDSRSDLIRELCENSNMTRTEATMFVEKWMTANNLVEEDGPFGKVIVTRER